MRVFSDRQKSHIARLYQSGLSYKRIARLYHCGIINISTVLQEMCVSIRGSDDPRYLPTPDDIERGILEIQKQWDDEERERRFVGESRIDWSIPVVTSPETVRERAGY